jgi:hypothetical protein
MKYFLKSLVPLLSISLIYGIIVSCEPLSKKQSFNATLVEVVDTSFPDYDPLKINPGPAHEEIVTTNPPGFHWLPEKGSEGFILEISRDIQFEECNRLFQTAMKKGGLIPESLSETPIVYRGEKSWLIAGLPLPLHRPSFILGTGNWYWRWRSVRQGGKIFSPSSIRRFNISPDFIEYKVPSLNELYINIPDSHPRLFIRPEQLDSLRGLLQTSKPHINLYARIENYADSLLLIPLNKEPDFLKEGDDISVWRNYYEQARKSGQVLDFLSFCYLMTGKEKYAERTREWLLNFAKWDINGPSSLGHIDEVAMPILLNGARAYDWIYDYLNAEDRIVIRKMLTARGEQVYKLWRHTDFHFKPFISHSVRLINYMSQVGVVLYGETPLAEKWLSYLIPITTTFYPPWGGRDGGYSEGPSYWMMYFNYMLQSAHCLKSATGLDVTKKAFYRNNGLFKIYAYPYYSVMDPFADTGVGSYWPANKMNLYRLATIFKNPYYRWRADMSPPEKLPVKETKIPTGIMSFLWLDEGPKTVKPKAPDDLPGARLFKDIGLVAFHEDLGNPQEIYFLLKSSPFGAWSHIYADQNSFYIQGFGEALAIQSGYYSSYGGPHHQGWTRQTIAHNSILVDGEGQTVGNRETSLGDRTSRGKIIAFKMGGGLPGSVDYAAGDATEAYHGRLNKFIRHVYYKRPKDFLLIDELEAPKAVRYDWLLHSLEKMQIDRKNNTVTISKGKAMLIVEFLSPEDLLFSQTNKFTPPPPDKSYEGNPYPDQWHLTVSTKMKSKATTFIVKMKVREIIK